MKQQGVQYFLGLRALLMSIEPMPGHWLYWHR